MKRARLSAVALGVALGFLCGGCMLVTGLLAYYGVYGMEYMTKWAAMYPGVVVTGTTVPLVSAFIAGGWGFLKGFFSGLVLGWIYNLCLCCCSRSHCACCKTMGESCGTCHDVEKI